MKKSILLLAILPTVIIGMQPQLVTLFMKHNVPLSQPLYRTLVARRTLTKQQELDLCFRKLDEFKGELRKLDLSSHADLSKLESKKREIDDLERKIRQLEESRKDSSPIYYIAGGYIVYRALTHSQEDTNRSTHSSNVIEEPRSSDDDNSSSGGPSDSGSMDSTD